MKDYSRTELENGIDEWIVGRNAERNRIILKLKLIDGWSYQQIANYLNSDQTPEHYHIEIRQLQRVIQRCCKTLFSHI